MKKAAFITGSSRGIGKAIAYLFASQGYLPVLHGHKRSLVSEKTITEIRELSPKSRIYYFDVADRKKAEIGCKKILDDYGGIPILVNNAGILKDRTFLNMDFTEWDDVIKTNLYGTYLVTKQILPSMVKSQFGRIINISSVIGITGNFGQANYAAAKAGIIGLTKSLAKETAKFDITVNAVCPGLVDTEILDRVPKEKMQKLLEQIPVGRKATPQEIAQLVFYLATNASSYLTGQAISINGGWL
jgi:NAD(P)-dependent dehydrogenase (short-subunit alcohol dehydrogenase family)